MKRLEAVLHGNPLEPIKRRIFILERNFFASAKRKVKLNDTLTSLETEVRGHLGSLNSSLTSLAERVEASKDLSQVKMANHPLSGEEPENITVEQVLLKNSTVEQVLPKNGVLVEVLQEQLESLTRIVQLQSQQIDKLLMRSGPTSSNNSPRD